MALVLKDRVKETTVTTGTGTVTLAGAVTGFQSFAAIGNGNETYYVISDTATGDWEVGIGTYTASGTTLSRTTVLSSSNGGSLVPFGAGSKDVFVSYPSSRSVYLDTAGSAVTVLDIGTLGTGTANITTANITAGTVSTTPTNNTDIVNKQYADAIASGIHFHEAVDYATAAPLPACTYSNGVGGVGATLTGNVNGALTVDSYTFTSPADNGMRILVKNQASGLENGVYTLTQAGNSSPGAPFILTRATDFNTVGTGVNQIDEGDFFLVTSGTVNLNTAWVQQTPPPITLGTTAIVFQQFAAPITYTAGTGLSESPSYTFNIATTGVTAATYGSASSVPVITVNAQGQATLVVDTPIAISGSAVSGSISGQAGSVANALTAGTYLTSGGTYDGSVARTFAVDATSANTASKVVARDASGDFSAGTITATLSGSATSATTATNLAGGAANQIPYQTGAGATSFTVAPSASNQVLNWNGSAFTWSAGTISGVPLGSNLNALTAGTYLTSGGTYDGAVARTFAVDATDANTASKVVARDASGNFSAGTITASLSGNASSASQVNNAATFNNSGSGGASGSTFNGSSPLTVSYNTVGAPSTTGTNASGTWGINITGNAATATSLSSTLSVSGGGTGLTSLTAGYIPYGSGTSPFGSTSSLFWDSSNGRLGLRNPSPQERLDIGGNARLYPVVTQQNTIQSVSSTTTPQSVSPDIVDPTNGWTNWTWDNFSGYVNVYTLSAATASAIANTVVGAGFTASANSGFATLSATVVSTTYFGGTFVTVYVTGVTGSAIPGVFYSSSFGSPSDVIGYNTSATAIVANNAVTGWISSETYISISGRIVPVSSLTVAGANITYAGTLTGAAAGDVIGSFTLGTSRQIIGVADDGTTSAIAFNPAVGTKRWTVGNLQLSANSNDSTQGIYIGAGVTQIAQPLYSVFIGGNAGATATNNSQNSVVIGPFAGSQLAGMGNVAVGYSALNGTTSGQENIAIGAYAGQNISSAYYSIAIGRGALGFGSSKTGWRNIAVGTGSLNLLSSGQDNIAIGDNSGGEITTGSRNVILGAYNGNVNNLDIRTSSNNIVIADGAGNRRLTFNGNGAATFGNVTPSYGTSGQVLTSQGSGASPIWTTVGGGGGSVTVTNDTTTATDIYPLLATATSGTITAVNTSNANLLYTPSTGELKAEQMNAMNGIFVNAQTITVNYTVAATNNAMSAGPVTVASGISVTVSSGAVWTVV